MPMELYSSEAFVRDLANAISKAEGKPLNIGGNKQHGFDRDYAFQLVSEAKRAVEGNFASAAAEQAPNPASLRSAEIRAFIARTGHQGGAAVPAPDSAAKRKRARPRP